MSFTIEAELPLGMYQGAASDGRLERMPSVARLHSALLCAAGFGPRAVPDGDQLRPCDADEAALRWLEHNPPDGVVIPQITVTGVEGIAYRDDGTLFGRPGKPLTVKKFPKAPGTSVAVSGKFVWTWNTDPPPGVGTALTALCADVPYLGTTESPVRLIASTQQVQLTHCADHDAKLSALDGENIVVCRPGRTAELVAAHVRRTVMPRESKAAYGSDEVSLSDEPPRVAVRPLRYKPLEEPSADVPWSQAILIPVSEAVPPRYRVRWAVAVHRALVSMMDDDGPVPALVTGAYPDGETRPPNRLAVHLLDRNAPVVGGVDGQGVLALLVPQGAAAADLQALGAVVDRLRVIRGPGGRQMRVAGRARAVPGARFWVPPQPGRLRLWRTEPAAVPDIRGVRDQEWTFAHAALLSLGFVFKTQLPPVGGRGDAHYLRLAQAVTEAGAAVLRTRVLRTTDVGAYAHRVNDHAVVRPYEAVLWLGDLAGPQTVTAIGQARHLGGGLLLPYDIAEGDTVPDDRELTA